MKLYTVDGLEISGQRRSKVWRCGGCWVLGRELPVLPGDGHVSGSVWWWGRLLLWSWVEQTGSEATGNTAPKIPIAVWGLPKSQVLRPVLGQVSQTCTALLQVSLPSVFSPRRYMYIQVYIYTTCILKCVFRTYIFKTHIFGYAFEYAYLKHIWNIQVLHYLCICTYMYMHICIHICTHICIWTIFSLYSYKDINLSKYFLRKKEQFYI